jgi:hypothetical protein
MLGDLRELGRQLQFDAAGDQHHHQTAAPSLVDRGQRLGRHLAPRCQRAVEIDGYHLKKRHRRPDPDLPARSRGKNQLFGYLQPAGQTPLSVGGYLILRR